jgi:hypothetical protein
VWLAAPLSQLQPDQKVIGQHDRGRMPIEPRPRETLVVIPAEFSFGLFMEVLDGTPPICMARQLFQDCRGGRITRVVLALFWLAPGRAFPR